jgi:hypothetical protein
MMIEFEIKDVIPKSHDLTIYVLGHEAEQFEVIKNRPYLKSVRLDELVVGDYQRNDFAESRFFFTDFERHITTNYVGLASASWNKKYSYRRGQMQVHMVDFLHRLDFQPDRVWAGRIANENWRKFSEWAHPGIKYYLDFVEKITGLDAKGKSLWSNNFICHKEVMIDFVEYFRKTWDALNEECKWRFAYDCRITDNSRLSGMLAERVSMYYWRSRTDLDLVQIEQISDEFYRN